MGARQIKCRARPGRGAGDDAAHNEFLKNYDVFKAAINQETQEKQDEIKATFAAVHEDYAEGMFMSKGDA